MTRFYEMTYGLLLRLSAEGRVCARCGRPLKPGDEVISKYSGNNSKRYHRACYNALFIEV